jgi:flagellin-like protein
MSIKNVIKSRKAISPILATLLLIVIAVAAIAVTYAWIMTYMSSANTQASIMLAPENVRFGEGFTEITVRNSGTAGTEILRIYMGNSSGNMMELTSYSDIGSGKPLAASSIVRINVTWPNALASDWESGNIYNFRVVPSQGSAIAFQEQAPV